MNTHRKMRRVSLIEKLRFVCGLCEEEAQAIVERLGVVDLEEIRTHTGLDLERLESILANPPDVEDIRLNPNQITQAQLEQIPQLKPDLVETVLKGRPYYSIEELEEATQLPRTILDDLFVILPLRFPDTLAKKEVALAPVHDRYIIPPPSEFEDEIERADYVVVFPQTKNFDFCVVEPSSFEEEHASYALKAMFGGNVHPVLRDSEGFERFLIPGSMDLWFKSDTPEDRRRSIIQELGLQLADAVPEVGYYRVKLTAVPDDLDVTRAVLTLIGKAQLLGEIALAEPDYVGFEDFGPEVSVVPGDDDFEAADRFWNHDAIDLAGSHAITMGSPDVTIFFIDSGCRMDHEELELTFRPDWQDKDLNFDLGVPESEMSPHEETISHGTKVAGVVRQVAIGCRILPVKISGKSTSPAYGLRAAAIRQALTYIKPGKRAVLNISWRTTGEHIGIREALKEAQSKGVAIVASAGNYRLGEPQKPDEKHYPSGHMWLYPQLTALCSVAAVGVGDRKASYSYYGGESVTVAAPGGEKGGAGFGIYTSSTPEKHAYTQGSSFAAPHVAGLIALLFSVSPNLTAQEAIQIIKDTADKIEAVNPTYALGAGRINARAALEWLHIPSTTHIISATAGTHGIITPSGVLTVNHGADQIFTITPDSGYQVKEVLVDGCSIDPPSATYTFPNVTAPHTIEASFESETIGRVNINQATVEELTTLPFIGLWLAERIVEYRKEHGPFDSIWELAMAGVSPWVIGQLKPWITI